MFYKEYQTSFLHLTDTDCLYDYWKVNTTYTVKIYLHFFPVFLRRHKWIFDEMILCMADITSKQEYASQLKVPFVHLLFINI